MSNVELSGVTKKYGASVALTDFSISINSGELVCLLGPSGCGKTTALRILAGFLKPDQGSVVVGGQNLDGVAVEKRNFGMVFQDYSLFPNMTSRENIDFGLKSHKVSRGERKETIERMLYVTALEDQADKYPHQMSGGQKQRVALARAIATQPRILLLDEPLSALDAKVRETLRTEIRRLQRELGVTTVFVTHDQHEALAIADRVGVMAKGKLEQIAKPRELYEQPLNPFVASFIGSINRIPAVGTQDGGWELLGAIVRGSRASRPGEKATLGVRPEDITVDQGKAPNGTVIDISFLGAVTRVSFQLDISPITVICDAMSPYGEGMSTGLPVCIGLRNGVDHLVVMSESIQ